MSALPDCERPCGDVSGGFEGSERWAKIAPTPSECTAVLKEPRPLQVIDQRRGNYFYFATGAWKCNSHYAKGTSVVKRLGSRLTSQRVRVSSLVLPYTLAADTTTSVTCAPNWKNKQEVLGRTTKGARAVTVRPSSYGCSFIKLYLLKVSGRGGGGGGGSEAKAHIPGLGRIQLERIHKAGTGTKLLAVLVWLSKKKGQHTPAPNSPWKHYGRHNGRPSVIYLHVFKFVARARDLDIHMELRRQRRRTWQIKSLWTQTAHDSNAIFTSGAQQIT